MFRETGSAGAVAAVFLAGQFLPALAAPALVARLQRTPTNRGVGGLLLVEALLFAGLAASATNFCLTVILVLVVLDGVARFAVAALIKAAIVATTSPAGLLREGNSVFVAVFTGCAALGPLLAGVVVAGLSLPAALAADAGSFALAAAIIARRGDLRRGRVDEARLVERLRSSLDHVREGVMLRRLLLSYASIGLFGTAILPLEIVLVTDTLEGSEAAYGSVLALWGAGAIAGSVLLGLVRSLPTRILIAGSFTVLAISYLGMGTAASVEVVCLFSLLGGMANGIEAFATMTAIQEHTAAEYQTRVSGMVEAIGGATVGLGFLLGGALATLASARAVYLVAGIAILALAAAISRPTGASSRSAARLDSPVGSGVFS